MKDSMIEEVIMVWENQAANDDKASPDRRATLRECADLLRMLISTPLLRDVPPKPVNTARDMEIARQGAADCYSKVYTFGSSKQAFCDMAFDWIEVVRKADEEMAKREGKVLR